VEELNDISEVDSNISVSEMTFKTKQTLETR